MEPRAEEWIQILPGRSPEGDDPKNDGHESIGVEEWRPKSVGSKISLCRYPSPDQYDLCFFSLSRSLLVELLMTFEVYDPREHT